MPRSASNRGFGFRSAGLVRILTAADPAEVLTAMEALGITLAPQTTFFDIIVIIARSFLGPLDEVLSFLEDVEQLADFLDDDPFAQIGPAGVPLQLEWAGFEIRARTLRLRMAQERSKFREAIEAEQATQKEQPPEGLTFTI